MPSDENISKTMWADREVLLRHLRRLNDRRWGTTLTAKFWCRVKVEAEPACWPWLGYRNRNGYGHMRVGNNVRLYAHRVSWELHYGKIPDGMLVCHRCDNPPCVNPLHLFLGSHADNHADRNAKGRQARGERHGRRLHPERFAQHNHTH